MLDLERYSIRRSDHAITDRATLDALLQAAVVGRVGVVADGEPYIVPMNFAYDGERIIVHGANQGRLVRAIAADQRVCFEVDEFVATMPNPVLCDYDTAFASVLCVGPARLLETVQERTEALRLLARKYATDQEAAALRESTVAAYQGKFGAETAVIAITVEAMTGKRQPFEATPARRRSARARNEPDLHALGNVPLDYRHHERVVSPGELLPLPGGLLKWYELRRGNVVIPRALTTEARRFLAREAEADRLPLGYGLGFAVLHYSDTTAYLIVGAWWNHQELWETLYVHQLGEGGGFRRMQPGTTAPTFCVWELAPVWHERQAWVRFLQSTRDNSAKQAYLEDALTGTV